MTESFTGIYSSALKDLCATIDPKDFVLFMFLCAHANEKGVCYPSIKKMSQSLDWRFEEVRYRLDRLERQSLLRYLRRSARHPDTGEFLSDLYQMNPRVLLTKSPVTHPAENAEPVQLHEAPLDAEPVQFRTSPSNVQHNQNQNQTYQPESETRISNQHQQSEKASLEGSKAVTGEPGYAWGNWDNANTNPNAKTQDSGMPAPAGTKTAPAGQAESQSPPSSAPPPINWQPEPRYTNALPDSRLEALANELKAIAPTRLYNARELVMKHGEADVRKGLIQLAAAKSKGNVYNPCGLLTTWLRTGALRTDVEAAPSDDWNAQHQHSKYRAFIET